MRALSAAGFAAARALAVFSALLSAADLATVAVVEDTAILCLLLYVALTVPAASDDIALTLNYKDVSKRLIDYVGQSGFGLVETLAERCAEIILGEFDVSHVRLKLSKPGAVRGARAVGVVIERGKP